MNMELNKNWRIRTDSMNFILEKKRVVEEGKNKGEVVWDSMGFYNSLDTALTGFTRNSMLTSDVKTALDLQRLIGELKAGIEKIKSTINLGEQK